MTKKTDWQQAIQALVAKLSCKTVANGDETVTLTFSSDEFAALLNALNAPDKPLGEEITFKMWLQEADEVVWRMAFCSLHDLPDYDFRTLYETGANPAEAAVEAITDLGVPTPLDMEAFHE